MASIDTVFVWVTDLERSLPWYRSLGIEPGPRHGAWQAMAIDGDANFALHQGERGDGDSTAVIAFAVQDLDSEIERLSAAGMPPMGQVTDTGVALFATFVDPDGNQMQLLERRIDSDER